MKPVGCTRCVTLRTENTRAIQKLGPRFFFTGMFCWSFFLVGTRASMLNTDVFFFLPIRLIFLRSTVPNTNESWPKRATLNTFTKENTPTKRKRRNWWNKEKKSIWASVKWLGFFDKWPNWSKVKNSIQTVPSLGAGLIFWGNFWKIPWCMLRRKAVFVARVGSYTSDICWQCWTFFLRPAT